MKIAKNYSFASLGLSIECVKYKNIKYEYKFLRSNFIEQENNNFDFINLVKAI